MFYADGLDVLVILASTLFAAVMLWHPIREVAKSGLKRGAVFGLTVRLFASLFVPAAVVLFGVWGFESLRLVYHMGAVVSMLLAITLAGALFAGRKVTDRRELRIGTALAMILGSVLPLALYMTFVEPYRVVVEEVDLVLDKGPVGESPIRIVVLADVQTTGITEYEEEVLQKVNALEPDLILIAGDLLQNYYDREAYARELPAMKDWLNRLEAKHGVYFVRGDVDDEAEELVEGVDIVFLKDQKTEPLRIRDRLVTIGGVELEYYQPSSAALIRQLETEEGYDDIRILLAHRPGASEIGLTDQKGQSRIDLVVAGHTHGGQVSIPFFGPPITLSVVPRHVAAGGLHWHSRRNVYVSRGVGMERNHAPRLRLNCRPEITLLTLR
jgi:predicted MPP superfamily phosphohydrolase